MPTPSFDVLVIGGGVNGLACAARLAGKGRKAAAEVLREAGIKGGMRDAYAVL